ncbi:Nuclease-related domain [Dehalogenimonas alkenigignens]|uniref:Nuclease-related domain n=1 Tax=Dehalogenimonas alkenigignens TaxID=1217799 RepID=A0A0W0GJA7_9CHLR|nr:nuclease-related domain-containing protein [Dehalogenimonas alkenigignens]KTB48662.1 Nuclease-related domain [Dehalogenimonas alkenigignens]
MNNLTAKREKPATRPPSLHYPGQSLDYEIENIRLLRARNFIVVMILLTVAVYSWMPYLGIPPQPYVATAILIGYAVYFITEDSKLSQRLRNAQLGSDGEKQVGEVLDGLKRKGYAVFHDIVSITPDFNIDHVVVSEHGIFAIETKNHTKPNPHDKVVYDGKNIVVGSLKPTSDPIVQVNRNAKWLTENLYKSTGKSFPVKPVVVYPYWMVDNLVKDNSRGTWVLNPKQLSGYIERAPMSLSQEEVQQVSYYLTFLIRVNETKK